MTEQIQQYNTYTTNYWDADVVVYTQNGNYYAVSSDGTIICTGSPTSCIQEAVNYLYNTKGGGKIYIKSGTYYINQNVVFPWHNGEDVIIEGEGPGNGIGALGTGTVIQINAPALVQSYQAVHGWMPAYTWLRLYLRNLTINISGDYSQLGAVYPFNMYCVWAKLDNVQLSTTNLTINTGTHIFEFGKGGAPGQGVVWTNVYLGLQINGITNPNSQYPPYGLQVNYEGFTWIGGGVDLNIPNPNNVFVPIRLMTPANNRIILKSIPLYIGSGCATPCMAYYIELDGASSAGPGAELELDDVEFPDVSYTSTGYHVYTSNVVTNTTGLGIVIAKRVLLHEGGPQIVPSVYGFVYQPGMLNVQKVSVPVGTGGNYGSPVNVNVAYANIVGATINVSNVASGETITVKLTMYYVDGSSTSETLTFNSSTTYTLGLNDYLNLANPSGVPKWYLQVQAASNLSSTSASVTVQIVTQ